MKKTLAFVMICMLVFAACSVASASWVSYSGKSLPKISSAITPNVTLGTTDSKSSSTQSGRHKLETCKDSSGNTAYVARRWHVRHWGTMAQSRKNI